MSASAVLLRALFVAALAAGGCTFEAVDIRLRADASPTPDALVNTADGAGDASADLAAPDQAAPDAPAVDAPRDREPSTGACPGHAPTEILIGSGGAVGADGVVTVEGTTEGGESTVDGCQSEATASMGTRVFRYIVQQGPRLVATTNTGLCNASATAGRDTILAAYFTCGAGGLVPGPRSCVDDDIVNVCAGMSPCMDAHVLGCGPTYSTIELAGLVRGDVVYLAVSSYAAMGAAARGPFRLSVAENGLTPAGPPSERMPAAANRCVCPPGSPSAWASRSIDFPRFGAQNQLASSTRSVFVSLPAGLSQVWGVSGSLRLSAFSVSTAGACAVSGGATAALDVILGTAVVASVSLGTYVGQAGTVTIPFTSFAPIAFAPGAQPIFQYRVRNAQPATATCVTLDVDLGAPNTLTLYGAM